MITFSAEIKKFANQGEKTGWSYIEVPAAVTEKLKPGVRRSYRVKGRIDDYDFKGMSLFPRGNGDFLLVLNSAIRKKLRKQKGDMLKIMMDVDDAPVQLDTDLLQCLEDDPVCQEYFDSLTPGHRKYFSNWIDCAKTDATKTKRIAQTLNALSRKQDFGEMMRSLKAEK